MDDSMMTRNQNGNLDVAQYAYNQGSMANKNKVRITQIHETLDYDALCQMRALRFSPPLG